MKCYLGIVILVCVAVQGGLVFGKNDSLFCPSNTQGVVVHCVCKNNCLSVNLRRDERNQLPKDAEYKCLDKFYTKVDNLRIEFNKDTYLFSCKAEYKLVGHEKVTCKERQLTGEKPLCLPSGIPALEVVLFLLVGLLLLALITVSGFTCYLRSQHAKIIPTMIFSNGPLKAHNADNMNAGTSASMEENIYDDVNVIAAGEQEENLYDDADTYRR